ncbi:MAG: acetate kinase [Acidobacteriia bacterium]|nr:acetate kinase [Terriglobia bacterium]
MNILVLNGGSSTLKATFRRLNGAPPPVPPAPLWNAQADWGRQPGKAQIRVGANGQRFERELDIEAPAAVLQPVLETLWRGPSKVIGGPEDIGVVGHRVVHGGHAFQQTARITPEVKDGIRRYVDFAPEHNRLELEAIEAAEQVVGPAVPQVAVFDTAFHATLPFYAKVYPVPYAWYERGVARYGFHGISHQYVSRRAAEILGRNGGAAGSAWQHGQAEPPAPPQRMITCHLGNGASLAAVCGGKSIDTTMGFTPLEGLMMGTRSGSIDPGILIYAVRHRGYGADQLDRVLNKESGLKGVSGISGDMREILAARDTNERARLAFDIYVYRLVREIGGMAASLGGLDALVFTAGIGENCAPLRQAACERLGFLGVQLDSGKNAAPEMDTDIASAGSRVRVLVVHTEEDWEIARECWRMMR